MKGVARKLLLITSACLLSACVSQTPPGSTTQSVSNLAQATWQEGGVFGYRNGDKGFSAGYVWQNSKDQYNIQLIGPLGAWRAKLSGDNRQAQLATSDGKMFSAKSPALLMAQNLGWSIPVENLRHWLWATPVPTIPGEVSRKANGEVTQIKQSGWIVQYPYYQNFAGYYLPARIVLIQDSKKITVVIDHFTKTA